MSLHHIVVADGGSQRKRCCCTVNRAIETWQRGRCLSELVTLHSLPPRPRIAPSERNAGKKTVKILKNVADMSRIGPGGLKRLSLDDVCLFLSSIFHGGKK
ncbi:Hypothetical predicted protein [Xyrichtys novacula]|uniref:Uncharacterized protein n=1 Tax=Xyrichtys novacula TaxID=13765 RepID=A0AAV1GPK2_XYRNO|nr:Hypothetical predicted protein [Xyrichtys novacula]